MCRACGHRCAVARRTVGHPVMTPEESAAVQALSLHALACVSVAFALAPKVLAEQDEMAPGGLEDAGAFIRSAEEATADAEDIVARHRRR